MIVGIGTDICRISRVERLIADERSVRRVFAPEEIEYARSGGRAAEHFAAAFAAKEAVAKASGMGLFRMGTLGAWVVRTETGPRIRCSEGFWRELSSRGTKDIWLSLTHEADLAMAFVVLEG